MIFKKITKRYSFDISSLLKALLYLVKYKDKSQIDKQLFLPLCFWSPHSS